MKIVAWPILIACILECPVMIAIFLNTGKPMALINAVLAVALIVWTIFIIITKPMSRR